MKHIRSTHDGDVYETDECRIYYANTDAVFGDNQINAKEIIHLLTGTIQVRIRDEYETYRAPATVHIPEKTYHTITAMQDSIFLLFR